ncbi:hypothetical protein VB773_11255 [Haloarculaceae archaeon H-GB2-1]|nr:hypothetical protein [Haloarculaceae archaeon H-GB11]MEA5408074.1 hypothetical protein [Haloarculaceae archaeon H-GB2-1]
MKVRFALREHQRHQVTDHAGELDHVFALREQSVEILRPLVVDVLFGELGVGQHELHVVADVVPHDAVQQLQLLALLFEGRLVLLALGDVVGDDEQRVVLVVLERCGSEQGVLELPVDVADATFERRSGRTFGEDLLGSILRPFLLFLDDEIHRRAPDQIGRLVDAEEVGRRPIAVLELVVALDPDRNWRGCDEVVGKREVVDGIGTVLRACVNGDDDPAVAGSHRGSVDGMDVTVGVLQRPRELNAVRCGRRYFDALPDAIGSVTRSEPSEFGTDDATVVPSQVSKRVVGLDDACFIVVDDDADVDVLDDLVSVRCVIPHWLATR